MFHRESEMSPVVNSWLKAAGLLAKSEFVTPWGICDFVGMTFNRRRVAHRLRLEQTKPISSITRAAVLLQIPDVESSKSILLKQLIADLASAISEDVVVAEIERLVMDRFVVYTQRRRLQKRNGWMPLQKRLVAIELKLSRIEEAFQQARCNLGFAQESFVAFPSHVAEHIASTRHKWRDHFDNGIGLIGVHKRRCELLIPAIPSTSQIDPAISLYCVEKFWRTHAAV